MTDCVKKPSHKEWRKLAKKARRKRIRQHLAEQRKELEKLKLNSPTYLLELEKKRLFEEYELEKEEKEREARHLKWLEDEEQAQKKWREEQRLKKLALEEKLKEQEKIRKEWEKEQKKIQEEKEKLQALKEEEQKRQQEILDRINDFIVNGGEIPPELRTVYESNPGKEICSFFQKVGACRFGSHCSRNHQYIKISNILMFVNFYTHFTLDQCKSSEYDTDISLEYDDSDMYSHFEEFYNDIVPEFKRFGEVTMVKVCCNVEPHLRGNVYVEYKNEREALVAYKGFQGRWYGGKQLNIEFAKISDWGSAVCGDFYRKRCPKGKSCNFLHVFKNPKNEFSIDWNRHKTNSCHLNQESFDNNNDRYKDRHWRWSETPERETIKDKTRSKEEKRSKSKKHKNQDSPSPKEKKRKNEKHKGRDSPDSRHSRKRRKSHSKEKASKSKKSRHETNNHS